MSSANGLTAQLEQNFLEAFQTVLKLILLISPSVCGSASSWSTWGC